MGSEVIGLHIVVTHVIIQIVYHSVRIDSPGVIMIMKGRNSHIAVNLIVFFPVRISLDVCLENRRIIVDVEGKLRPVEIGIFGNRRIEHR